MPSQETHLDQANMNEGFAQFLLGEESSPAATDWAATALFYAALHLVDAYLANSDHHPTTHKARGNWVAWTSALSSIYASYSALQHQSELARYYCQHPTKAQVIGLFEKHYSPGKRHVLALLSY